MITARLDRLPATRHVWTLIVLLSVGGCFELYDLLMTAYISPGLIRAGIFHTGRAALFGGSDQAAFISVTFAGLFFATIGLGHIADRWGRRTIFTVALLWYSLATLVMATRSTALGIDIWRFIAALGVGVELVTIDTYLAELVPKRMRGRAFLVNQMIQFCSIPLAALMGLIFAPRDPFGIEGWRYIAGFAAIAAVLVWWIRRKVPESPRWLAQQGRGADADRITAAIEARVAAEARTALPPAEPAPAEEPGGGTLAEILAPRYRRRTIMLIVFNLCQAVGYYGFHNWVPALLAAQGATFHKSLVYSFVIALASPTVPLLFYGLTDRIERKWQLVGAAAALAGFGALFTLSTNAAWLILCGIGLSTSSNMMSYAFHAYQPELFPTRMRARAVGFVYSFSRLSTIFSSFIIAYVLARFGAPGVFGFIGAAMLGVVVSIGAFGPRTRGLALEEISH